MSIARVLDERQRLGGGGKLLPRPSACCVRRTCVDCDLMRRGGPPTAVSASAISCSSSTSNTTSTSGAPAAAIVFLRCWRSAHGDATPTLVVMPGPSEMPASRLHRHPDDKIDDRLVKDRHNRVFPSVQAFVDAFAEEPSKARPIHKVLIATNGIAAVKCITSMRKLLMQVFKDDHIVKFICLTTEQEVAAQAEYLKLADSIVFSPSGANTNNYANVDEIIEHAISCEVDAVWAGWGHASENPRLPEELNARGITFIGPPADAMFALGDKIASTIIAQTVNVPTIEWSGSGIRIPESLKEDAALEVTDDLYGLATVSSPDEGLKCLTDKHITYPVMIKASEGGGGKGIRKCITDEEFVVNFRRVQAEVPGSPVFIMKCMEHARHIEVQLIADAHGNCIPLYTRDCSIQRRCQKIIEEAPAQIAPPHVLRQMQVDAVNLAKRVGYVSAGTVEFMYLPSTQKYYFLELNPRLQVEHPCTEMISDVNIPSIQLQIAMGIPLHRIVDLRLFHGLDRYGTSPLPYDFVPTESELCVIAARITSEDPAEGFRPASGTLEVLNFRSSQNVWGYFSVAPTGKVHEFADSQFGHIFSRAPTRHEAISGMLCALKELELRATFQSQANYLVGLLQDPVFEQNAFHTGWLDERIAAKIQSAPEHPLDVKIAIGATVIGQAKIAQAFKSFEDALSRGQILPTTGLSETVTLELVHHNVKYSVTVNRCGDIDYLVLLNDDKVHTKVHILEGDGAILVQYNDQVHHCTLDEELERYKVTIGHNLTVFEKENDPSILRSRNAGRLLQYLKSDGETIGVGEVFAEMESMKMVIALDVKKVSGKLVQVARPGQVLFPGTVIARLEVSSDVSAARPVVFEGGFAQWARAEERRITSVHRLDNRFETVLSQCKNVLAGYSVPEPLATTHLSSLVGDLFTVLDDNNLPYALYRSVLQAVKNRISKAETVTKIEELLANTQIPFRAAELSETMELYLDALSPNEVGMEKAFFEKLLTTCDRFGGGLEGHKRIVVQELLEAFLNSEKIFQGVPYDKAVTEVLKSAPSVPEAARLVFAHTRIASKNTFVREVLARLSPTILESLKPTLRIIANLYNTENESLAVSVRQLLAKTRAAFPLSALRNEDCVSKKLYLNLLPENAVLRANQEPDAPYRIYEVNEHDIHRIFVRYLAGGLPETPKAVPVDQLRNRLADDLDAAIGAVRLATPADKKTFCDCNHIFITVNHSDKAKTTNLEAAIKAALFSMENVLAKLKVTHVEVSYKLNVPNATPDTRLAVYSNETGVIPEFSIYRLEATGILTRLEGPAKYDGVHVETIANTVAHPAVQRRRALASRVGTVYAYDLPEVFGRAALDLWKQYKLANPKAFNKVVASLPASLKTALTNEDASAFAVDHELILESEEAPSVSVLRTPEENKLRRTQPSNDRGMLAWELKLYTPDAPTGRAIVVIANDVTHFMGSFSMREHRLYHRASEYSRANDMPRVYVAANSGARIGFAADIKQRLSVVWNDDTKPEDGFAALCLDETHGALDESILNQVESHRDASGNVILDAVIGKENDIGVENLVGSGLIAGETSAAYKTVPTYCLVTGRAVGIGAYAARLSHRVVQVEASHLILTGANALNSLLGREIYTSNGQLGGPQIMHANGVSHAVVGTDLEGVARIVRWITYLPKRTEPSALPTDDTERPVETLPTKAQYDPREVLDPATGGGLFDAGSFDEIMSNWAQTIIAARARLCGVSVGVVAVETRTITVEIPADPAAAGSEKKTVTQAGQVWYPDSAYKTAEAINDFNKEGLPLVLLANIRGFSGGQKDMFEMVLKFGAAIVDALQAYTQPVIVYIPPFGELRGGAWAVLDTQINSTCITMIADNDSRGGVLEPDGIVEIKFRQRDLNALMLKCDAQLQALSRTAPSAETKSAIAKRQEALTPVYRTIAVKFADLHDTTARMLAKGAIHDRVEWREARNYIHRLLRVQLARFAMARRYLAAIGTQQPYEVSDLETACHWVDAHLAENGISFRADSESAIPGASKFVYSESDVSTYATSQNFAKVLRELDYEKSTAHLLELDALDDNHRIDLAGRLLSSTTPEARQEFLRQLLAGLNPTELQSVISSKAR
uniref:Acetyl-CoA carboxylase n=1 Tax=Panagrellus redivivus TaxID=6233 RepID=A0A7E4VD69_PANRE